MGDLSLYVSKIMGVFLLIVGFIAIGVAGNNLIPKIIFWVCLIVGGYLIFKSKKHRIAFT